MNGIGSAAVVVGVLGGGALLLSRFGPIDGDVSNGFPKGGPLEARDLKHAAGAGVAGLLMGAPMGLIGAAIADAPKSMLNSSMLIGALGGAALLTGAVIGTALRD